MNDGSSRNMNLDERQNITAAAGMKSERWWQEGTVVGCCREQGTFTSEHVQVSMHEFFTSVAV